MKKSDGTNLTNQEKSNHGTVKETMCGIEYQDYLTDLPNRGMFEKILNLEIAYSKEEHHTLAVLLIDLKRFQVVNMGYGYETGDSVLIEVTKRLKVCLEGKGRLFRSGDDELAILFRNSSRRKISKMGEAILTSLSSPVNVKEEEIFVSPRIGISVYPKDGLSAEELFKAANFALTEAKKDSMECFVYYGETYGHGKINPFHIEMDLHKAIKKNELYLLYQPKVNLTTGDVVGVEALIRWEHPKWGLIAPRDFIPIAEESGLIIPIGDWVIETACKQNKKWQAEGVDIIMSVNLSSKQFMQKDLVGKIAEILERTDHSPSFLELEITESVTVQHERAIQTLKEMKQLGIKVSIDDFGTGFSSLKYVKKFPVDTIKIDQSFIRELSKNPMDETIVKTIITMAHELQLNVIAEGIETPEQFKILQKYNCDEGQGFYLAKPRGFKRIKNDMKRIKQRLIRDGLILSPDTMYLPSKDLLTREAEKFEVINNLAAGIADEIRNPMTSVKGFVHFLEQGRSKEEYYDIIHSSIGQIEEYIKKLLWIGSPYSNDKQYVNIRCLLDNVKEEFDLLVNKKNIELIIQYTSSIQTIWCDQNQIRDVFKELLSNSIEKTNNGGEIRVIVYNDDKNLIIKVIDNGKGMSNERLKNIGEPYFCLTEEGSGLGFLLINRIVQEHGGKVLVTSKQNVGTTVKVFLPLDIKKVMNHEI